MKTQRCWMFALIIGLLSGGFHIDTAQADELLAWGGDSYGESSGAPGEGDFAAVGGGYWHSVALSADGTLLAWGDNLYGQCNVPGGSDYVAISSGAWHGLALTADGALAAWGRNTYGQCDVPEGIGFTAIAAGGFHNSALAADGTLVAWGHNSYGQCDVPEGEFVAIANGGWHSLGLASDGSIVAWGRNDHGQCGVPEGGDFVKIAAGVYHNLAVRVDGSLAAWGRNNYGQCEVPEGNDFVAVACGEGQSLALTKDGVLLAWGRNDYGQSTAAVLDGMAYTAVAAGWFHDLALVGEVSAPENHEPVASGQDVVVNEDTEVSISLDGADEDGDALTYQIVTQPLHGTLSGTAPTVVYTPDGDYYGQDSFSFQVSDGTASSNVAAVNIVVESVNDAPSAVALANGEASVVVPEEDWTGATIPLDASASSDPDGDALSFAWDFDGDGTVDSREAVVAATFEVGGPYIVAVTVSDAAGLSSTASVSVTVTAGTAADQVTILAGLVEDSLTSGDIAPQLESSLTAKLENVGNALAKENPRSVKVAVNNLKALIHQIDALRGKKIDEATADEMLERINAVLDEVTGVDAWRVSCAARVDRVKRLLPPPQIQYRGSKRKVLTETMPERPRRRR